MISRFSRMSRICQLLVLLACLSFGQSHKMHCSNCTCTEIPPHQLTVNCSSRNLSQVPPHLPSYLTTLDLSHNSIDYISPNYFETFPNLTFLDLSYNHGLGLKNASISFFGLRNSPIKVLKVIQIVRIHVGCVALEKDFFIHLKNTSLQKVYLDLNRILTIEKGTLNSIPATLDTLSLRKSRLVVSRNICKQFLKLKNVRTIDVSHLNREAHLQDIMSITEPTEPSLLSISGSTKLVRRSTSTKVIIIIVPPNLENLYVKDCNFKLEISEWMDFRFSPNKLKVLDLSKNRIGKMNGKLSVLETLEELNLSENVCDHISPKFSEYVPNLKKLNLRGNKLYFKGSNFTEKPFRYLETLDLSSNRISKLSKEAFEGFPAMKNLLLGGNLIYNFNVRIDHMSNLSYLDLSHNQINYLSIYVTVQLDATASVTPNFTLNLSGNPLSCSCKTLTFVRWICTTSVNVSKQNLECFADNDRKKRQLILKMREELENDCTSHVGIAFGGLVAVTGCVVIAIMAVVYRFRWKLRYWYYVVRGKYRGNLVSQHREDADFDYDAFISYAEEDSQFAINTFTDKLETEGQLRLCIHQRDFRPGEPIAANILSAMQRSRHVVIVLSPNFLDSNWCRWEFEMARMEGLYTERNVVVLVRYQEVPLSVVPRDLLYMMHTQTYLEYPEGQQDQDTFWTALKQAIEDN